MSYIVERIIKFETTLKLFFVIFKIGQISVG